MMSLFNIKSKINRSSFMFQMSACSFASHKEKSACRHRGGQFYMHIHITVVPSFSLVYGIVLLVAYTHHYLDPYQDNERTVAISTFSLSINYNRVLFFSLFLSKLHSILFSTKPSEASSSSRPPTFIQSISTIRSLSSLNLSR